ncbi:hypothetical protein GCM10008905_23560 [Clostridium malenominatum]|uniref:Uncharacterized protein n=1 Tax=Clostridium malenominatum TaxID=1539 RepID=A0ABN1J2F4_9CLOT
MSKTDNYKENKDIDRSIGLSSFFDNDRSLACTNVRFNACQICKTVELDPSLADVSRLLRVRIRLVNVCPGKEVTLGCIVTDTSGNPLVYKSDTFIATRDRGRVIEDDSIIVDDMKDCNCGPSGVCIDVTRVFTFLLPESNLCSPLDCNVRVIANYTSPGC